MGTLFSFDKLITPSIIHLIFYVMVAISILSGLSIIIEALAMPSFLMPGILKLFLFVVGIIVAVFGILVSKVGAEMVLVIFMIRDELAQARMERKATV